MLTKSIGSIGSKLYITQKVVQSLISEGLEMFPYEYTALLAGQGSTICSHIPHITREAGLHSFSYSGEQLFTALRLIAEQNLQWLGVIHTHPTSPAIPSLADQEGWHYPMLSYWILSFYEKEPELRFYKMENGQFILRSYEIVHIP